MQEIFIQQILVDNAPADVWIEGDRIRAVAPALPREAVDPKAKIIDGRGMALMPGFVNMHTHSAMTLFRGVGEDVPLQQWLEEKVWPYEAQMDEEMIYWGMKLACLEMIRTGTTTFNDMYWSQEAGVRASEEMGLRSVQAYSWIDFRDPHKCEAEKEKLRAAYAQSRNWGPLTSFAVAPHAIYTVSDPGWEWISHFARQHALRIHTHLSESRGELEDSLKAHGVSPVRYLEDRGVLGPHVLAAHSLWIGEEDIRILGERGVTCIHNPNSNFKLSSGYKFKYQELMEAGARVCLGTDGAGSSNNLDMIDTMKMAAYMQKAWRNDPAALPLPILMDMASRNGAEALGVKAGRIAPGYLADLALVDLHQPAFVPAHDFRANLVYAANGYCIDTVICNGRILMEHKHVPGEDLILQKATEMALKLFRKSR